MIDKTPFRISRPILPEDPDFDWLIAERSTPARTTAMEAPVDRSAIDELQIQQSREAHLFTEELILALGSFAIILSMFLAARPLWNLLPIPGSPPIPMSTGERAQLCGSGFALFAAAGLLGFRWWSRIPILILCVWGFLEFPVGTFLSTITLIILFNHSGRQVLTPHYVRIRAATPWFRCSTVRIIGLCLMLVLLATIQWFVRQQLVPLPETLFGG